MTISMSMTLDMSSPGPTSSSSSSSPPPPMSSLSPLLSSSSSSSGVSSSSSSSSSPTTPMPVSFTSSRSLAVGAHADNPTSTLSAEQAPIIVLGNLKLSEAPIAGLVFSMTVSPCRVGHPKCRGFWKKVCSVTKRRESRAPRVVPAPKDTARQAWMIGPLGWVCLVRSSAPQRRGPHNRCARVEGMRPRPRAASDRSRDYATRQQGSKAARQQGSKAAHHNGWHPDPRCWRPSRWPVCRRFGAFQVASVEQLRRQHQDRHASPADRGSTGSIGRGVRLAKPQRAS
ncbi:MAG: hypothetical protein B7733_04480 [Myxococcales bacterium FL481]|nr:MAG: hypothetical protein B7733_04480 [Myxococcales bacterium FL481]